LYFSRTVINGSGEAATDQRNHHNSFGVLFEFKKRHCVLPEDGALITKHNQEAH